MSILGGLLSWGEASSKPEQEDKEEQGGDEQGMTVDKRQEEQEQEEKMSVNAEHDKVEVKSAVEEPVEANDESLYEHDDKQQRNDILAMDEAALDEELDRQLGLYSDTDSLDGFGSADEGDENEDDELYDNDPSWLSSFAGNTRLSSILKSFSAAAAQAGDDDGDDGCDDNDITALNALRASVDAVSASVDEFTAEVSVVQRLAQSALLRVVTSGKREASLFVPPSPTRLDFRANAKYLDSCIQPLDPTHPNRGRGQQRTR